jgi:hypothetical protein
MPNGLPRLVFNWADWKHQLRTLRGQNRNSKCKSVKEVPRNHNRIASFLWSLEPEIDSFWCLGGMSRSCRDNSGKSLVPKDAFENLSRIQGVGKCPAGSLLFLAKTGCANCVRRVWASSFVFRVSNYHLSPERMPVSKVPL